VFRGVTTDGVWIDELDLLTTCRHHSELQVITCLSLISILHKLPQHPVSLFPTCCVSNSSSLAMASNSRDSSASRAHIITSRRICCNSTLVNSQFNYSAISSQPVLQSSTQLPTLHWTHSLTHQPTTLLHFTSLNWIALRQLGVLGVDPTENIASNSSTVVMGGCLEIVQIPFLHITNPTFRCQSNINCYNIKVYAFVVLSVPVFVGTVEITLCNLSYR
jgi:hypothetical protein